MIRLRLEHHPRPANRHIRHWAALTYYENYFLYLGLGIGVVVGFLLGWWV